MNTTITFHGEIRKLFSFLCRKNCGLMLCFRMKPMHGSRGGRQGGLEHPPPLENYKAIGFLSNTGSDPLENHKATKPAINVGPLSAHQGKNALMAFRWRANDGPFLVVFGSSLPSLTKKTGKKNVVSVECSQ